MLHLCALLLLSRRFYLLSPSLSTFDIWFSRLCITGIAVMGLEIRLNYCLLIVVACHQHACASDFC